jgi:hypothetical protein
MTIGNGSSPTVYRMELKFTKSFMFHQMKKTGVRLGKIYSQHINEEIK